MKTSTPVRAVERTAAGVTVREATGAAHRFDKAVLAVPAWQALALLADPTPEQRSTLGALTYTPMEAVLHTDRGPFGGDGGRCGINIQLACTNPDLPPPVANRPLSSPTPRSPSPFAGPAAVGLTEPKRLAREREAGAPGAAAARPGEGGRVGGDACCRSAVVGQRGDRLRGGALHAVILGALAVGVPVAGPLSRCHLLLPSAGWAR